MSLVRWEPFRDIYGLQREMNRLFDDMFSPLSEDRPNGLAFAPSAELDETNEAYLLKLEIPGLAAKDINIEVTEEAVSVSGERKSERRQEEGSLTRTEFQYGSFKRVVPLPSRIDNQAVAASYENGILNLTLPKCEDSGGESVKVTLH